MANDKGTDSARETHLDCIRGFAAICVMTFHCVFHIVLQNPPGDIFSRSIGRFIDVFDFGKLAVVLFFAMSGYVIPLSLLRGRKRPVSTFLVSRIFRLYPAYWLSMLLGVAVLWRWNIDLKVFLSNTTMFQAFVGIPNVLGVYWTLQIELVFYGICALVLALGFARTRKAFLVGFYLGLFGALALAIVRDHGSFRAPVAMPLSLAVMFWGDLKRRSHDPGNSKMFAVASLVLVLALVPICVLGYRSDGGLGVSARYLLTYYVGLFLFHTWVDKPSWNPAWLAFVGRISFGVYLLHPVAMGIGAVLPTGINPWITTALVVVLTIPAAAASYEFVESPAIRLGHRVRSLVDGPR